jgi:predicted membrane channel-forming protein YqfA (hemolysin III family)
MTELRAASGTHDDGETADGRAASDAWERLAIAMVVGLVVGAVLALAAIGWPPRLLWLVLAVVWAISVAVSVANVFRELLAARGGADEATAAPDTGSK